MVVTIIILVILATISINMVFSGGLIDKADLAKERTLLSEYEERIKIITLEEYTNKMIEGKSSKLIDLVKEKLENEDWVANVENIEEDQIKVITKDKYIIIAKIGEDGSVEIVAEGKDDGEPYPSLTLTQEPYNEDDGEIIKIKVEAEVEKTSKTKKVTTVRIVKPENMKQEKEYTEGGVIFEVTGNGVYTVEAESNMGKTRRKTIEINIAKPESDIEIASEPITARNTESTGTQNGIAKGPINVEIKYGDNSYIKQYRKETDESWTTVSEKTVNFQVTENIAIFAKYSDGTNTFKTVTYNIKNVDNVEPTIESIETQVEGATVTVNAVAKDEAKDSKGVSAATGIEGIARYEYSINGKSYQESNKFNITSPEMNTVYVKAIDKAGNEKIESKKIDIKDVATVEITNIDNGTVNIFDDVTTTFTAKIVGMNYKYQWYYNDTAIGEQSEELSGERTIAFNVPTNTMTMDNYSGGTYKCKVTNGVGENEVTAKQTVTYTISDANQMKNFAKRVNNQSITFEGKIIEQTADIDLSSVCGETIGSWDPIANYPLDDSPKEGFKGDFNGNNYKIKSIYINSTQEYSQGLFGVNYGSIKNVHISSGVIKNEALSCGGIVATNYSIVENCSNNASVTGVRAVGGIVGSNLKIIRKCYNTGSITGNNRVGGIVGDHSNGGTDTGAELYDCYNTGEVKCSGFWGGGIAGVNYNDCIIENSYNVGKVINDNGDSKTIFGVVGDNFSKVTNCYYLENSASAGMGKGDVYGQVEVRTEAYMKTNGFVENLGTTNWKIVDGLNNGYPVLSWEEGTAISGRYNAYFFYGILGGQGNVDDKKTVTIKPGACQYGPYVTLTPGKYQIRYVGDNFNSIESSQYQVRSIYSEEGTEIPEETWPIVISIQESNRVIYTVEITKTSPNTEFMLYNPSTNDKDISVKFIEVIRLT